MNKGYQPAVSGQRPAESVEQRGLAEGNAQRLPTNGTQRPGKVSRGLLGVREPARRDRKYHPWPNVRFRRHHPRQEPYAVAPHVRICGGCALKRMKFSSLKWLPW
jgi:hypothetical protein